MHTIGFDDFLQQLVLLVGMTVCRFWNDRPLPCGGEQLTNNKHGLNVSSCSMVYKSLACMQCVFGNFQAVCAIHGCQQTVNVMLNSVFLVFLRFFFMTSLLEAACF